MTDLLIDGPENAESAFIFAHGAGAPMDSEFMETIANLLAGHGMRVIRFEFPYMAERRVTGSKKPPPRAETMMGFMMDFVAGSSPLRNVLIGGKSMGGRIASLIADELHAEGRVSGLVCLGYPFHPPGKPERLRTAHLETLTCPALICQGERDPFGTREEVGAYRLSPAIRFEWLVDGNHDLAPRKASGRTKAQNWQQTADAIAAFANQAT